MVLRGGFWSPRPVVPGVYRVQALASSVALLEDGDGLVLVDAGARGSAGAILRAVRALGYRPEDVRRVLVTHFHPDHIGALAAVQCVTGARVHVSAVEADVVAGRVRSPNPFRPSWLARVAVPLLLAVAPASCPVDGPLVDGARLPVRGGLTAVATSGHTPGSTSFYLPAERLLITGDAVQRRGDRLAPPHPWVSWDMRAAAESVRRLAALDVETLVMSHFQPVVRGAGAYLADLARRLAAARPAGYGEGTSPPS